MKVKSNTLQDYVNGKINEINSLQNAGSVDLTDVGCVYAIVGRRKNRYNN